MRASGEPLRQGVKCFTQGCRWQFRETILADLGAAEKHCPRCKARQLIVFRRARHVATVAYGGRNEGALRTSLQRAHLLPAEVDLLVEVARLMAT